MVSTDSSSHPFSNSYQVVSFEGASLPFNTIVLPVTSYISPRRASLATALPKLLSLRNAAYGSVITAHSIPGVSALGSLVSKEIAPLLKQPVTKSARPIIRELFKRFFFIFHCLSLMPHILLLPDTW